MEALRRLLLYAEMSREKYKACLPDIQRSNRQRVTAYLGIACAFLTVLWILSGVLEFLRPNMLAYMIALAVCMGLQAVNRTFPGKNGLLLTWLMYAFEALLYVLGIYLGIHPSPDTPTVSFIAFLLAVPLLFVMRPIQHILNVVFFDGVFILTCFLFKSKETLPVDILDGMVFGAVSCIISTFIMLSMHENFSIRHKLLGIAETDLNVGLKNRNAHESQMHDYPMHCSSTLSCVYLDVNGLHELNNTRGHAAGDEMLKTVAAKVRDIFGEKYSYRVGGDEFVAFAMDKSAEEMRAHPQAGAGGGRGRLLGGRGYSDSQRGRHRHGSPRQIGRNTDVSGKGRALSPCREDPRIKCKSGTLPDSPAVCRFFAQHISFFGGSW